MIPYSAWNFISESMNGPVPSEICSSQTLSFAFGGSGPPGMEQEWAEMGQGWRSWSQETQRADSHGCSQGAAALPQDSSLPRGSVPAPREDPPTAMHRASHRSCCCSHMPRDPRLLAWHCHPVPLLSPPVCSSIQRGAWVGHTRTRGSRISPQGTFPRAVHAWGAAHLEQPQ